ncbi:MAG: hypothetical protein FWC40_05995 [Proteobacteria bacterium]|nr:hypothetical protein [Pseudomonadota bacterium]
MTNLERNAYLLRHYQALMALCHGCARLVHRRFSTLSIEDLRSYAMEGIIRAIDKSASDESICTKYLYVYGYHHALHGALQMCGHKRRTKTSIPKGSHRPCEETIQVDPDVLTILQEERQRSENYCADKSENRMIRKLDRNVVLRMLENPEHRFIYEALMAGTPIQTILASRSMTKRTFNKAMDKIKSLIEDMACGQRFLPSRRTRSASTLTSPHRMHRPICFLSPSPATDRPKTFRSLPSTNNAASLPFNLVLPHHSSESQHETDSPEHGP